MTVQIESPLGIAAKTTHLVEKQRKGQTTPEEDAFLHQSFIALAAVYNDIMYREYAHRQAHNCAPDWKCKCSVHSALSSECSNELWRRVNYLDPTEPDQRKNKALSAKWWEERGFKLVQHETDSVFDWILLADNTLPVPENIVEKAASWWVDFLAANLPGKEQSNTGTFASYQPTVFDPIDWTPELRSQLQLAIASRLKQHFPKQTAPDGLAPFTIDLGPSSASIIIFEPCLESELGPPQLPGTATMFLTPASIRIEHTVWHA